MTKRELAALACKVLGLYAFISAINSLPLALVPLFNTVSTPPGANAEQALIRWGLVVNALPGLLHILAGLLLWFGADALAGRMVNDRGAAVSPVAVGAEAQVVAFSCLGLWSLLQTIPRIGQDAANLYMLSQQDAMLRRDLKGMTTPDIIAIMIQLALGLWLLFGAAGLVRLVGSFRTIGVDNPNSKVTGY